MLTERYCCRCTKPLTDAASMEAGIGPVCRKKDNHVLACQFSRDMDAARSALVLFLDTSTIPEETRETFDKVLAEVSDEKHGLDYRTVIKRIEWLLSWPSIHKAYRDAFASLVEALGYAALANIWRNPFGVAGAAKVRIANGRLYVKGPRNRAALEELRKLDGRKWEPATKEWSVPASAFKAFERTIRTVYPENDGDWSALAVLAASAVSEERREAKREPKPAARLEVLSTIIVVRTPYNPAFVSDVKALPWRSRKWDGSRNAWLVDVSLVDEVKDLVRKHYGAYAIVA